MQRKPAYWKSPDQFYPQRWCDPDSTDNHEAWRPFSSGRHVCPGADYANRVSQLVIARLAYKYTFQLADPNFQFEERALSGMLWSYPKAIVYAKRRH